MRVLRLNDARQGLNAFVVIDHDLFPVAAGGTRMLADVDVGEIARLARAMTWKFAACGLRYAGAKAGVRFSGGDRTAVLGAFRRALEPYSETFLTGPDMGTAAADFLDGGDEGVPLWARSHDGLGMDDLATGHGVTAAAAAALAHIGRGLNGATIALEGFGKVGAGTALSCTRAGARVVGVSTVAGSIADPDGFDVAELLHLRACHGDRFVHHSPRPARRTDALFELDCDVLVPGARPDSITAGLARRLHCDVVAPAANAPYAAGAVEILHERGIVALPDFLSNSGGVHLYDSIDQQLEPAPALTAIEALVQAAVSRTLIGADELGITPYAGALRAARGFLAEATGAPDELLDALFAA
jgi:glutamate dehydrogenase (NAD(P)+)